MTRWKLIVRSLTYHRRTNLSVLAGALVGCAVLVGALAVGDSVRESLAGITRARLGDVHLALTAPERFFSASLAERLSRSLDARTAAVLEMRGVAALPDGSARAPRISIYGVDESFWKLGRASQPYPSLASDEVALNEALSSRLGAKAGDTIIVRTGSLSALPIEAPFTTGSDSTRALRLTVKHVLGAKDFGRFSLRANQAAPMSAFLSRELLAERMERPGEANLILISPNEGVVLSPGLCAQKLPGAWTAQDAGIEVETIEATGELELRSNRVFVDAAVREAAESTGLKHRSILAYFVNSVEANGRRTPYSVIAAPDGPPISQRVADGEIVVNDWLAEDLGAAPGDRLTLRYYVIGEDGVLREDSRDLKVSAVVEMSGAAADRSLMPDFPGIAKAGTTSDWEPGVPVDLSLIREKDEKYWYDYRGTPKAFVTANAAREMWGNRFGDATAIRFDAPGMTPGAVRDRVMEVLAPEKLGFAFTHVRARGLHAAANGVDFGQLFVGLSFFVVIAGLILTGLLFVFSVEGRAEESGTLLAIGFRRKTVRRLLVVEGGILALAAGVLGAVTGIGYDAVVLKALSTIWRGAVLTADLSVHVKASSVAGGAVAATVLAVTVIWIAARGQSGRTVRELGEGYDAPAARPKRPWRSYTLAAASFALAGWIAYKTGTGRGREAAGAFFGAGALLLAGGMVFVNGLLLSFIRPAGRPHRSIAALAVANCTRRKGQSLAVAAMLACGVFLVVAVGANRSDPLLKAGQRSSGTGGFAFYAESTLPIAGNLNTAETRQKYALADAPGSAAFVSMKASDGDDASCLNLNRTSQPRILGVEPEELERRGAFSFASFAVEVHGENPWLLLDRALPNGEVPGIADETVIVWGLGKKVGDTISAKDENGEWFDVRLLAGTANSVLQGNVLISRRNFTERFPSAGGSRVFLIDSSPAEAPALARSLERGLADFGMEVTPTAQRLAAFNSVENTYLTIFLALGGLGLLIGSVGMGVVLLRNVLARRGELALLAAVGFSRRALVRLVLWEHWLLLAAGLVVGTAAAVLAVLPAISSPGAVIPYLGISVLILALLVSGMLWTFLATRSALSGDLLAALRNE